MLTLKIQTEDGVETWQAAKVEDEHRDFGWYTRQNPGILWSKEPIADADASRGDVAQMLREKHGVGS